MVPTTIPATGNNLSLAVDSLVSTSNTGDQTFAKVAISGNHGLMVWQSMDNGANNDIRGKLVDVSGAGITHTHDFLISTNNAGDQIDPAVAISGNLALIAWESNDNTINDDIRGRVVDFNSTAPVGAGDFLISSSNTLYQGNPKLAVTGNVALVVWTSNDNKNDYDVRGRLVDLMNAGTLGTGDFLIPADSTRFEANPDVAAGSNGKALVTWYSK